MSDTQPRFYRGEFDSNIGEMASGAKANAAYLATMSEGPWSKIKSWRVGERCFCITGMTIPNHTFVEGESGLILIDPGMNIGNGQQALQIVREFSDKPVVALIYTHNHYTGAAQAVLDAFPELDIPVYGHPAIAKNMAEMTAGFGPGARRRAASMLGGHLPQSGPDASAVHRFIPPPFDDPDLRKNGHVAVTHPVQDGEMITIDGVNVTFHHVQADTDDSLVIHFPDLDLVVHNAAIMPVMFPLYTLRGDYFRHPLRLIEGIDIIRRIKPQYLVGCHGYPVLERDEAYELATANRDLTAYLFQQTIQGMNAGLTPDQLAQRIALPPHLKQHPGLARSYMDVEYAIRGIYRGMIGWWGEDAADLNPPAPEEFYGVLLDACGGADPLLTRAREAFEAGKYNLTAKLMSAVLSVQPDNLEAKQLKADALRNMGHATPCGIQARNFFLTEALHLEGKIDRMRPPPPPPGSTPDPQMVLRTPPGTFLKLLEVNAIPDRAENLFANLLIRFTDLDISFGLAVRGGAVELSEELPSSPAMTIEFERSVWAHIVLRVQTLKGAVRSGEATVRTHDQNTGRQLHAAFATIWGEP